MTTYVPSAAAQDFLAGLRGSGADVRVVEAGTDKASTLANFARDLDFPDWFGLNYDALYDCLLGLPSNDNQPVEVVLDHAKRLRRSSPEVYEMIERVLSDAHEEREGLRFSIIRR